MTPCGDAISRKERTLATSGPRNIALFVRMRLPRTPGTTCRSIQQCQTVPLPTRATDSNHPRKVESLPVVEDARAELVGWQAGGLAGGAA